MLKMLVFDMDGTLLKSDHSIDEKTLNLLHQLEKEGMKLVIATGRSYGAAKDIIEVNKLKCDLILNNGHEMRFENQVKYVSFTQSTLLKIMEILHKYNMHVTAFAANNEKYSFLDKEQYYEQHMMMEKSVRGEGIENYTDKPLFNQEAYTHNLITVTKVDEFKGAQILKIDTKNIDTHATNQCIEEIRKIENILISSSGGVYIELIENNAHKGTAVLELGNMYGIKKEEICAFGDGHNDIEMLQMAGHSFAMGNACEEVKNAAKYVTETHNEQGVYKGLLKVLNQA